MKWRVQLDKIYIPSSGDISIEIPENTNVTVYESNESISLSVSLHIKKNSLVTYVTGHAHDIIIDVVLEDNSSFTQTFVQYNAEKREQRFELQGKKSSIMIKGSYALSQDSKTYFTVLQRHQAEDTVSSTEIKSVLDDKAQLDYRGTIVVEENASRSKAHQQNKNLIVSSRAQAFSLPILEASTNDIQCGHGSATSYINDNHLFYLASRGVNTEQAKKMIIHGFITN